MTTSTPNSDTVALHHQQLLAGQACSRIPFDTVVVEGKDRAKFLHNFCTANIKELGENKGTEAFVLNVKGKTIGFGYVFARNDCHLILTAANQADNLIQHFDRYVINDDVQLSNRSGDFDCWCLASAGTDKLAGPGMTTALAELREYLDVVEMSWENVSPVLGIRISLIGPHDLVLVTPSTARQAMQETWERCGLIVAADEAFEIARIEQGTPYFGIDISDANLPQEIRRDENAISFTKGCYLGQETVARIDALGHVNKFLVRLKFPDERIPQLGSQVSLDGTPVGTTRSACYSPVHHAAIALGFVKRGLESPGSVLESEFGEARVL